MAIYEIFSAFKNKESPVSVLSRNKPEDIFIFPDLATAQQLINQYPNDFYLAKEGEDDVSHDAVS